MKRLALLALLGGCGVLHAPDGKPTSAPVFAVMRRFACLGPCPDYELTVYADGVVEYDGYAYVYTHGKRTTTIGAAGVELLRRRFAQADYMHLADDYTSGTDDAPGIGWLIYQDKRVQFEGGYEKTPFALESIAMEIEQLAHSDRWACGPDPHRCDRD